MTEVQGRVTTTDPTSFAGYRVTAAFEEATFFSGGGDAVFVSATEWRTSILSWQLCLRPSTRQSVARSAPHSRQLSRTVRRRERAPSGPEISATSSCSWSRPPCR